MHKGFPYECPHQKIRKETAKELEQIFYDYFSSCTIDLDFRQCECKQCRDLRDKLKQFKGEKE